MKRLIICLYLTLAYLVLSAQPAQDIEKAQQEIEAIAKNATFRNALIGVYAITGDGTVLVDVNAEKMLAPASNMKLISTGAALQTLGGDYRFRTDIAYDGYIEDGILNGNLYIIGGGDPTLGSKNPIANPLESVFSQWTAFLKDAGIKYINGYVVGDGRFFEGMAEEATWMLSDAGTYYGTGTSGLMFYENMLSFSASAGPAVGEPVNIKPSYPETPWMTYRYVCTTGEKETGDQLYMYTNSLSPIAEICGTFGVDRAAKRVDFSNKFPEYTCAYYFCKYLQENGVTCMYGPADYKLFTEWSENGEQNIIGSTFSPELRKIIHETNRESNNLYAETLIRILGKEKSGRTDYDSSRKAIETVIKGMDINMDCANIQDGSGLSRQNYVSPEFICDFLVAMMDSPDFEYYAESLPSPGGKGTLYYNMSKYPAAMKERIKAKSGSMNGVRCYSGYIIPTEGSRAETIIFSIMTNNCTAPTWDVRPLLDKIMGTLGGMN